MSLKNDKERRFWEIRNKIYSLFLKKFIPYDELIDVVIKELSLNKEVYILDAGCGPGLLEKRIILENAPSIQIEAIDISERIINIARENNKYSCSPNINFRTADLNEKLGYKDQNFDTIVCINVFYLLERPKDTLLEFYRILKRGGKIIIITPKYNFNYSPLLKRHFTEAIRLKKIIDIIVLPFILGLIFFFEFVITIRERKGRYHRFKKEDISKLFQEAGFRDVRISDCYAQQNSLIVAKR